MFGSTEENQEEPQSGYSDPHPSSVLECPEIRTLNRELAYTLTCEATLRTTSLCIQNGVDTVQTARRELVIIPLVS